MDENLPSQGNLEAAEIIPNQALTWNQEDWRHELVKLSPEDVSKIIPAADITYDPLHWKDKLAAAISGLNDKAHLEAAGRALSLNQSHEIFTYINRDVTILDKLPPLFVGMSHQTFCEVLLTLTPDQLDLLKQEALTEAIQHHLTLVTNELIDKTEEFGTLITRIGREISTLPLENITHKEINIISKKIEDSIDDAINEIKIANNALAIAWNTLRIDIIDQLSQSKEDLQRMLYHDFGSQRTEDHPAIGLHALLEDRLNTIFIDALSDDMIKSLPDETPAIEALVKFGIWYDQDYIDIGLLPNKSQDDNDDNDTPSLMSRQAQREETYLQVTAKLKDLGLNTLKDLKENKIFSKKALLVYINQTPS